MNKALAVLGLGGLGWWLYRRAQSAQLLNFSLGIPTQIRFSGANLVCKLPVVFTNGSPQLFRIGNFFLPVYIGTSPIGQLQNPTALTELKPNGNTTVLADVSLNLLSLPRLIIETVSSSGKLPEMTVKGNVNIGNGNLFVNEKFTLQLPKAAQTWLQLGRQ